MAKKTRKEEHQRRGTDRASSLKEEKGRTVKMVIFDLDDTLFPSSQLSKNARIHACEAMIREGLPARSPLEAQTKLKRIVQEHGSNYQDHFGKLCESYHIRPTPKIIAAGIVAYHKIKVARIDLFPKVQDTLLSLIKEGYRLVLITEGNPIKQWEKIIRLNIRPYFQTIRAVDSQRPDLKRKAFEDLWIMLRKESAGAAGGISPKQIVVVGDRLDREISYGNRLGFITVRVLQGRRRARSSISKREVPTYTLKEIADLPGLLHRIDPKR
ncbi:MAG: HAD hydrolase-like protein [DPANN group archaeon]|nr:HAD hydrolase-like protein [DPANN group archaeon]